MKTVAEYRADLFDTASQFKTVDVDELAKIDRLIQRSIDLYSSLGYTGQVFNEIIVYAVAAQLRDDELSKANKLGVASFTAGIESKSFFNASSNGGNPYRVRLRELTGEGDSSSSGGGESAYSGRRSFGAYMGGTSCP